MLLLAAAFKIADKSPAVTTASRCSASRLEICFADLIREHPWWFATVDTVLAIAVLARYRDRFVQIAATVFVSASVAFHLIAGFRSSGTMCNCFGPSASTRTEAMAAGILGLATVVWCRHARMRA